ncbi:type II toxin-antitoxin system VapC family toxin [Streptomyces sp. ST2-7A]|uniref:type II toxin-antitoxin system VapC family toxin n=1 Tax=Streptomyces sp. ST2-7A TaxID=2907214 RepID=UPI001F238A70|nr:type II toxin-antitoxin system VapC family toxin [Streptomyces sp. ST2-7A]MCE7081873.1 type II toxin-antitoxin system VapC family toxin [Streptomyces sp. ST2-7A]
MIVTDTSALVGFLVGGDIAAERLRALLTREIPAVVRGIELDCASVLSALTRRHHLPPTSADRALTLLSRLNLRCYDPAPLLPRIRELDPHLAPPDACHIALAETLGVPLLTMDRRLVNIPGVRCPTRLIRR